jgi:hypothetical protein
MTTPPAMPAMRQGATRDDGLDPIAIVKNVTALVRSTGLYPAGHTVVQQALQALDDTLRSALDSEGGVRVDVIGGDVHLDGRAYRQESMAHPQAVVDFTSLGLDSLHVDRGVTRDELAVAMAAVLAGREPASADPIAPMLEARGVRHVVGRR